MTRLPHRYPFLLLDRIAAVRPSEGASARKLLTLDDLWCGADGTFPSTLIAEIMAQCAGLAMADRTIAVGVLAKLQRFRVRGAARAGDLLEVEMRIGRIFGPTVRARGVVRCNGRRWAAGEVILQMAPRPSAS
jgi:3-hydroxyacyl-[acyl-carrier-protein] dehydratase